MAVQTITFSLVPNWLLKEGMQAFTSAVTSWDVGPFWDYYLLWPQNQTFQQEERSVDSNEGSFLGEL